MSIDRSGQEILLRTAMVLSEGGVEARCAVSLPARGRTILARRAEAILLQGVPRIVEQALTWGQTAQGIMREHVRSSDNASGSTFKSYPQVRSPQKTVQP